jgi:FixJ family two-component response regulator
VSSGSLLGQDAARRDVSGNGGVVSRKQTNCVASSGSSGHIALVDDEAGVRRALERLLRASGFRVTSFPSAEAFLDRDPPDPPDCLVCDIWLDGMSGTELQTTLAAQGQQIPTVIITAHDDSLTQARSMAAGAVAYLTKPVDEVDLIGAIQSALGCKGP